MFSDMPEILNVNPFTEPSTFVATRTTSLPIVRLRPAAMFCGMTTQPGLMNVDGFASPVLILWGSPGQVALSASGYTAVNLMLVVCEKLLIRAPNRIRSEYAFTSGLSLNSVLSPG